MLRAHETVVGDCELIISYVVRDVPVLITPEQVQCIKWSVLFLLTNATRYVLVVVICVSVLTPVPQLCPGLLGKCRGATL